jgi:hypothetical protein
MKRFGQYRGPARAMELVGERRAMLIRRDLAVRPRRSSDLLTGLPGVPTNAAAPQRGVVYAMTPAGPSLEPAILAPRRELLDTFIRLFAFPGSRR